jgi:hypothetical protein
VSNALHREFESRSAHRTSPGPRPIGRIGRLGCPREQVFSTLGDQVVGDIEEKRSGLVGPLAERVSG